MLGFPRASRMLHASEFASTLKTRPAARSTFLVLNHKRASSDERARLGLIVPKRFLKQSVSRNRVKRVLRECFRLGAPGAVSALDIVVVAKKSLDPGRVTLDAALRDIGPLLARMAKDLDRPAGPGSVTPCAASLSGS